MSDIQQRLQRIYSAIGLSEEADLSKFRAKVSRSGGTVTVATDFSGGRTQADLENIANSMISNIAHFRDHLRRWAAHNNLDKEIADRALVGSTSLQIITDLANNDKHGYPPRNGGYSKRAPRLVNVRGVLRLSPGKSGGSSAGVILTPSGELKHSGDGSAKVVVTGEIVDQNGVDIGMLNDICEQALKVWEEALEKLGVSI